MERMIQALLEIQKRDNITQIEMAKILGMTRQQWWRVHTGRDILSAKAEKRALARWQQELLPIFLSNNITISNIK